MKDKQIKPLASFNKSFFNLKETSNDGVKLTNFIHKGQSHLYNIMNKIESCSIKPSQHHANILKKFFHRLRGDRKGSIKGLHFEKLFQVDLKKISNGKHKTSIRDMFNKKLQDNKKLEPSYLSKNNTHLKILKSNNTNPIKLFKSNAENLRKLSSVANSILNSCDSDNLSRPPFYITSTEYKSKHDHENNDESKAMKSIHVIENDNTFHSNRMFRTNIYNIRGKFDESLRNLESTVYKKKPVNKQSRSLSIASDQSLFKQRIRRTNMIENITNVEVPKIENAVVQTKKKKYFSADYTQTEIQEIMKEVKLKGFYITDRLNNKRYLSIDENHTAMTKDYYMNRITENSAMKYVNYVKTNYLTNTKKKYDKENLFSIIHKEDIKTLNVNRNKLYNLDRNLDFRLKKLLNP
jgi:hypothetical protein